MTIVIGPLGFALLRGEFPLLWSFTDSAGAESDGKKDETIEAPSEAAQRSRAEAKAKSELTNGSEEKAALDDDYDGVEPAAEGAETPLEQDDSWMNEPVGVSGGDAKARKRKNKKK